MFLLYNSPDARNATSEILRQGADLLQTEKLIPVINNEQPNLPPIQY